MVRSELVKAVAKQHPTLSAQEAEKAVEVFFDEIVQTLVLGGRVEIRDFGSFSTRARNARTGRNPRTGEMVAGVRQTSSTFQAGEGDQSADI